MTALRPGGPAFRAAFIIYACVLVTATHWPALAVQKPFELRLDLFIHAGAFGAWTLLLLTCGFFGGVWTRRNLVMSASVAGLYAGLDELTQVIPVLHRTVDGMDLVANLAGVLAGAALGAMAGRLLGAGAGPDNGSG